MRVAFLNALVGAATALVLTSACAGPEAVEKVDAGDAAVLIEAGEHTVIDVRTPAEFAAGHVEGAENIDVTAGTFEEEVGKLDKSEEYLVYCQSGNRSADAAEQMADLGFSDVVDGGGINSLESAGAPIVTGG